VARRLSRVVLRGADEIAGNEEGLDTVTRGAIKK